MNLSRRPQLFSNRKSGLVKKYDESIRNREVLPDAGDKMYPRGYRSRFHQVPSKASRFGLGETRDTLISKWKSYSTPARLYIARNQRSLVAKSRDLLINNEYGRGFLRQLLQNILGENGIRFQGVSRRKDGALDRDVNEAIEDAWMDWGNSMHCDLAEVDNFVDIQQEMITSLGTDGEFFCRMYEDKSKYGLRLQALDGQRCSPIETQKYQNTREDAIYNGILFDRATMKPIAYLFSGEHTNDNYYDDASHRYDRIPAEDIVHGFLKERTGQKRGLPVAHAALNRNYSLDKYEEAALENARVGAAKAGFLKWREGFAPPGTDEIDEDITIDPRTFTELPPGLELDAWDPAYPDNEYPEFVRSMLRAMATGMGVGYHDLANDFGDVNFSSLRQSSLNTRENWKVMQEWFIRKFMWKVYRRWLPIQLRNGNIRVGRRTLTLMDLKKCLDVSWTGRRWDWVDPKTEAIANTEKIRMFLTSPSAVIRELGGDPIEVWTQWAEDYQQMIELGIPEEFIRDAMTSRIQQVDTGEEDEQTPNSKKRISGK
ncbi:phage portal protein [Candidatus Poribacteria bacterium]|nr:phage portal protein [Candidatus Poribacteria bacterium]